MPEKTVEKVQEGYRRALRTLRRDAERQKLVEEALELAREGERMAALYYDAASRTQFEAIVRKLEEASGG